MMMMTKQCLWNWRLLLCHKKHSHFCFQELSWDIMRYLKMSSIVYDTLARPYKKRPRYIQKCHKIFHDYYERLRMTNVMLHYLYLVVENYVVGGKKSRLMFFLLSRQAYLVELYFFSSVWRYLKIIKLEN